MSITKPPLLWIGGSCYRGNPFLPVDDVTMNSGGRTTYGDTMDVYDEDDGPPCDAEDSVDQYRMEELPNGRFRTSFHVPKAFFGLVIGKKGAVKIRLENETKTRITVPPNGSDEKMDVTIVGEKKSGILAACNRLSVIVQSARSREAFTHFVSIPLNMKPIQGSFNEFKKAVMNECEGVRGLDDTIFQNPCMLHLTVCTAVLLDVVERTQAIECLQDCKERIFIPMLADEPLEVEISGLEIMNDDPAEVDVLYAKVRPVNQDAEDVLQKIADKIVEEFVSVGLSSKQYERVKLHMTLMNSLFRREPEVIGENEMTSGAKKIGSPDRETFNAKPILEKFRDWNFGIVQISEVHLSQRRSSKRHVDGYYMPSVIVSINTCG